MFLGLSSLAIMIFFRVARRLLSETSLIGKIMRATPDVRACSGRVSVLIVPGSDDVCGGHVPDPLLQARLSESRYATHNAPHYLHLLIQGVRILGDIKGGFPVPIVPPLTSVSLLQQYLPYVRAPHCARSLGARPSIIIGVLGFVESILVAKIYARKNGYMVRLSTPPDRLLILQISPNRELVAFGTANIIGAFFQAYPTFGSLTRSAVAQMCGFLSLDYTLCSSVVRCVFLVVVRVHACVVMYSNTCRRLPNVHVRDARSPHGQQVRRAQSDVRPGGVGDPPPHDARPRPAPSVLLPSESGNVRYRAGRRVVAV